MRKNLVLLIFTMVAGIIVCNSFGWIGGGDFLAEESSSEQLEIENTIGEEEVEDFEDHFLEYAQFIVEVQHDKASQKSFYYDFAIQTFCLEPEEYPPCC